MPSPSAPLFPCLKPSDWALATGTVSRRLWDKPPSQPGPWLAFGYDHPEVFEFLRPDQLTELHTTARQVEAQALANLRSRKATWELKVMDVDGAGQLHLLMCSDDFLAAERILDVDFMRQAHTTIHATALLAAVPRRGVLVVTEAGQSEALLSEFASVAKAEFDKAESSPISPRLFIIKDGAIVRMFDDVIDIAAAQTPPEPAARVAPPQTALATRTVPPVRRSVDPQAGGRPAEARRGVPRARQWVLASIGLILAAVLGFQWYSSHDGFPNIIDYRLQRLKKATGWTRDGISGAVFVGEREYLPTATVQIGVMSSARRPTADALDAWIREEYAKSPTDKLYDSGPGMETCKVGVQNWDLYAYTRTFVAVQVCKTGHGRAACAEDDEPLAEVIAGCIATPGCLEEACDRRRRDDRAALATLVDQALGQR